MSVVMVLNVSQAEVICSRGGDTEQSEVEIIAFPFCQYPFFQGEAKR